MPLVPLRYVSILYMDYIIIGIGSRSYFDNIVLQLRLLRNAFDDSG